MKSLARIFKFEGYEVKDVQVSRIDETVEIYLDRKSDKTFKCNRCGCFLGRKRGHYKLRIRHLSIMEFDTFLIFWRVKGECKKCNKARSEQVDILSKESPHYSREYSEWIGAMCEFAAVSRVAEFCDEGNMNVRRMDFGRMKRLLKNYKIPKVKRLAVDEVYARKKPKKGESRNDRFFTVISDLDTRRVIWVSEGRSKEALNSFFDLIGKRMCRDIIVVAMDQFEGYAKSVKAKCKYAKIVWDRFHLMQNFEEAVNETRKDLHNELKNDDPMVQFTRGKYRFIFLKKAKKRSKEEEDHMQNVFKENEKFLKLELIKEKMITFFDQKNAEDAKDVLDEMTVWIWTAGFKPLKSWADSFHKGWETVKNYFDERVTSALAEGLNNVIKTIKKQAYGFRNMEYFRYKIMQVCGYLNSRHINSNPKLA